MTLSQGDRNALVSRVEQRLGGRDVNRAAVEAAVDAVLARLAMPDESPMSSPSVYALSAEFMPDLASRVRQRLTRIGEQGFESGAATVGRFTVVALRTHAARERLDGIARELGARLSNVNGGMLTGAAS